MHKAQVPEWCTGITMLLHWVAIAMFCTAAVGFAFCLLLFLLLFVCIIYLYYLHTICCVTTSNSKKNIFGNLVKMRCNLQIVHHPIFY